MSWRITLYGQEGRSSTKELGSYMRIAIKENEFDLESANLHIAVILSMVKSASQEVVDMIQNDEPYMILKVETSTSKASFYAKLFKDFTTGMFGEKVVIKRVKQDGQIGDNIGVFRSQECFDDHVKMYEKGDTLNTEYFDITLKEIDDMA